jgi:GT2 family glycosyltransferase
VVPVAPLIAVVVPAHDRPLRLRWLLNALEDQTLERERFEVLVAAEQDDLLALAGEHPVGSRGVHAPGTGPAERRNAGWRAASAPLVVFTDDDCRPPADWLARLLAAAEAHPGAVVQGATRPDPDELDVALRSPHARTQEIEPPTPWGQTCNILYPRELLDRLGGFDESFPLPAGEDTDLLQRALAAGTEQIAAPEAVTYHCVEAGSLRESARIAWRWQALPLVLRRHPHLRDGLPLRLFWKPQHAGLCLGLLGLVAFRRRPLLRLLAWIPWVRAALPSYGTSSRGRLRAVAELPARAVVDAVETVGVAKGAVKHRTPML